MIKCVFFICEGTLQNICLLANSIFLVSEYLRNHCNTEQYLSSRFLKFIASDANDNIQYVLYYSILVIFPKG